MDELIRLHNWEEKSTNMIFYLNNNGHLLVLKFNGSKLEPHRYPLDMEVKSSISTVCTYLTFQHSMNKPWYFIDKGEQLEFWALIIYPENMGMNLQTFGYRLDLLQMKTRTQFEIAYQICSKNMTIAFHHDRDYINAEKYTELIRQLPLLGLRHRISCSESAAGEGGLLTSPPHLHSRQLSLLGIRPPNSLQRNCCKGSWSPDLPPLLHGRQLPRRSGASDDPRRSRAGSDPRQSRAGSNPRRSRAGSDLRQSRAGSNPRRSRAVSDPRRSRAGSDPRQSRAGSDPRRSRAGSDPRRSMAGILGRCEAGILGRCEAGILGRSEAGILGRSEGRQRPQAKQSRQRPQAKQSRQRPQAKHGRHPWAVEPGGVHPLLVEEAEAEAAPAALLLAVVVAEAEAAPAGGSGRGGDSRHSSSTAGDLGFGPVGLRLLGCGRTGSPLLGAGCTGSPLLGAGCTGSPFLGTSSLSSYCVGHRATVCPYAPPPGHNSIVRFFKKTSQPSSPTSSCCCCGCCCCCSFLCPFLPISLFFFFQTQKHFFFQKNALCFPGPASGGVVYPTQDTICDRVVEWCVGGDVTDQKQKTKQGMAVPN
ncbi:UNVERIFIED_CONTAM: hypothetical protein FKN15_040783 [Acipenser sinensis]